MYCALPFSNNIQITHYNYGGILQLTVGDCFGTFEPIQGMEASSK